MLYANCHPPLHVPLSWSQSLKMPRKENWSPNLLLLDVFRGWLAVSIAQSMRLPKVSHGWNSRHALPPTLNIHQMSVSSLPQNSESREKNYDVVDGCVMSYAYDTRKMNWGCRVQRRDLRAIANKECQSVCIPDVLMPFLTSFDRAPGSVRISS